MITIVYDCGEDLLITGSTQPICERFSLLKDTAPLANRSRLRLNENYARVLDKCSDHFSQLSRKLRNFHGHPQIPSTSLADEACDELYQQLVTEEVLSRDTLTAIQNQEAKQLALEEENKKDEIICQKTDGKRMNKNRNKKEQKTSRLQQLQKKPAEFDEIPGPIDDKSIFC